MTEPPAAPECSLQFIGNATTVLRLGPFTLLTDPNFLHRGQRAYLGHGLWSKRRTDPALQIADLPPLDAVLLSHMHGDHWDRVARRGLDRSLPVLTTPAAARALKRQGFRESVALPTGRSTTLTHGTATLTVTSTPGRHAPGPARLLLPPVMGSLLDFSDPAAGTALRLYISGDTLLVPEVRRLATATAREPLDVAVLHLGGTRLLGLLTVTMTGRDGAELTELLGPTAAVPVHFDDYPVFASPLSDYLDETARRGIGDRVRVVARGETARFAPRTP